MSRINIIGLGGIGSALIPPLSRWLSGTPAKDIVLVDGDKFSRGNSNRQNMSELDIGEFKVVVHARCIHSAFRQLNVMPINQYISGENASDIIINGDTIFLCVDNHATRKLVSERCQRLDNITLISGGNELTDGSVQIYLRRNGRNRTPAIERYHPEIANPKDKNPADLSCEELARMPGSEQVIFTNFTAACIMLNAFYSLVSRDKTLGYTEVYFDIITNKALPRKR